LREGSASDYSGRLKRCGPPDERTPQSSLVGWKDPYPVERPAPSGRPGAPASRCVLPLCVPLSSVLRAPALRCVRVRYRTSRSIQAICELSRRESENETAPHFRAILDIATCRRCDTPLNWTTGRVRRTRLRTHNSSPTRRLIRPRRLHMLCAAFQDLLHSG